MIHLTPEGGLCNRMRAIASVWHLAQDAERPLTVHWLLSDELNCSFEQLFDTRGLGFKLAEREATGAKGKLLKLSRSLSERLTQLRNPQSFVGPEESAKKSHDKVWLSAWARGPAPRMRTHSKVLDVPGMFRIFQPHPDLQRTIDSYKVRLDRSIGVHIRRTDNLKSAQFSSLSSFKRLMDAELGEHPETSFFVATDSFETFADLRDTYGDRVFQHTKTSIQRNDPRAIHDAVIDLYCLASCRKLIGSYWSSFSDTAWEIHGIDHHIVRDNVGP